MKEENRMNKILIIDDDKDIANSMAEFLKGEGYSVLTSMDPISSLWQYSKFQPDLVICDVNMPEMNGIEVLKKIREQSPISKVYNGYRSIPQSIRV